MSELATLPAPPLRSLPKKGTDAKNRILLAIKGLAIVGVVSFHLLDRRSNPETAVCQQAITFCFAWCVLGFFCVSGYLHALSDERRVKTVGDFVWHRTTRLLVPFVALILFYSVIWQVLMLKIPKIGAAINPSFTGKILDSLWPVSHPVAEQLYFLPLLFAVSLVFILARRLFGIYGVAACCMLSFFPALVFFSSFFTGFSLAVLTWGLCFYSAGYLLRHFRNKLNFIRITILAATILFVLFGGVSGLIRSIPLWLMVEGARLRLDRSATLVRLGEASGSIYIYHTPFLLQPLVIASTFVPGAIPQLIATLAAGGIAIVVCLLLYEKLINTRAKVILM